jgi:hypothetical protein
VAYFTVQEARRAFERRQLLRPLRKSASQILTEEVAAVKDTDRFDIFLSHCVADAEVVEGIKTLLEEQGNTVYVDWIVDKQLDRTQVRAETANVLRRRMRQSDSLFFATSSSSPNSKWMPWELGYFDGLRHGRIAILPLVATEGASFQGQQYLGLYPLVEQLQTKGKGSRAFVTQGKDTSTYMDLGDFRAGSTLFKRY